MRRCLAAVMRGGQKGNLQKTLYTGAILVYNGKE